MPPSRKPKPARSSNPPVATTGRLIPPRHGAVVRMYRIGHGDCFLLAFDGESPEHPVYVLIDCGYKPGSPQKIARPAPKSVKDVTASIREATGGDIDVAIITHEHQDHVNGITTANFAGLRIRETWLAWTEDPDDEVANALRQTFKDQLLGLVAARRRLAAAGHEAEAHGLDEFLALELGGEDVSLNLGAASAALGAADLPAAWGNKQSMKLLKDRATDGVRFLRPHEEIHRLPRASNARVFVLGPPRSEKGIRDVDPQTNERFFRLGAAGDLVAALGGADSTARSRGPFAPAYGLPFETAFSDPDDGGFFRRHYGGAAAAPTEAAPGSASRSVEVPEDADWRRIGDDWLFSALELAIQVNNATNNTSLVLAFELGRGGKVLLFTADAQRGNWTSWTQGDWNDGDKRIRTKDLLSRTVLYKVGHHGSHNATLNGTIQDPHPNLSWMGRGTRAGEFTAMIPAVRAWAIEQVGWNHPLPAIKEALLKKCAGRVFQTDTDFAAMQPGPGQPQANWKRFQSRVTANTLYFDYRIEP